MKHLKVSVCKVLQVAVILKGMLLVYLVPTRIPGTVVFWVYMLILLRICSISGVSTAGIAYTPSFILLVLEKLAVFRPSVLEILRVIAEPKHCKYSQYPRV